MSFLIFSCKPLKFKDNEYENIQKLFGEIKQINHTTILYPLEEKDTTIIKIKSTMYFEKGNKLIKQINEYAKEDETVLFQYKKDNLFLEFSEIKGRKTKTEYFYDKNDNNIKSIKYVNDKLWSSSKIIFDKFNNKIEKSNSFTENTKDNDLEKFNIDYKNRIVKIETYDSNTKLSNNLIIRHYNKKGYLIKSEFIYLDSNKDKSMFSKFEYDSNNYLLKESQYDILGNFIGAFEYKNIYDKNGNIIEIEKKLINKNLTEKIIEKYIYKIEYLR